MTDKKDLIPTKENTMCWYPFIQLAMKDWRQQKVGPITPCCNMVRQDNLDPLEVGPTDANSTIDDLWNHPRMNKLRDNLKQGIKDEACKVCWEMEEKTGNSYRLDSYQYDEFLHPVVEDPVLKMYDLRLGDACNLRCRMCGPTNSNQLRIDAQLFKQRGFEYKNWPLYLKKHTDENSQNKTYYEPNTEFEIWQDLKRNLKKIRSLKATGGETLVSRSFIELMDYAIQNDYAKNISLDITTNATKFTKQNLERFSKFRKCEFTFSIDGINRVYEYIRYPAKFSDVDKSLHSYLSNQNINHDMNFVNFVMQSYNILDIRNTFEYFTELCDRYGKKLNFHVDPVFPIGRPTDICWLPKDILKQARDDLRGIDKNTWNYGTIYSNIEKAVNYIDYCIDQNIDAQKSHEKLKQSLEETKQFDMNRNQHYKDFLPGQLVQMYTDLESSNVSNT